MGDRIAPSPHNSGKGKGRGARKQAARRRKNTTGAAATGSVRNSAAGAASREKRAPEEAISGNQLSEQQSPQNQNTPDASGARPAWLSRTAYAALDLGTNNCRLLIARVAHDGFTVVDAFSRVVRLGEGLNSSGKISDAAMDRAIEALSVCADKLKRRNVVLARSVATEACRQAVNGAQFIERVKNETGIVLDVISPKEEARLAVMGCHALLEPGQGPALIFDIGGGSTEVVLVSTDNFIPEILDWVSVPWGVVSLTESEPHDEEDAAERMRIYAVMRAKVSAAFADFAARLPTGGGDRRLLGTSGTVTTLASVYLQLQSYDRRKVDGLHLPSQALRDISQTLANRAPAGRAEFPTIGVERSDLVVAGCAILESIFDMWPGERLGVADRGIREGILRALMASDAKRRERR
jgi:exopolyphosphatase / guanosine-5'-triphosphate,3'-diphosphate pyrophosphatase